MALEHRQNATQYLYLHLFTTKFVAILLTVTQQEAQRATVAHLSTMNAREFFEWNQK